MFKPLQLRYAKTICTKVYGADAANLVQSPTDCGALEFWHCHLGHLDVKGVHMLQNVESDMNLGKFSCPTSSLLSKACIKDTQHMVVFFNEGRDEQPNL